MAQFYRTLCRSSECLPESHWRRLGSSGSVPVHVGQKRTDRFDLFCPRLFLVGTVPPRFPKKNFAPGSPIEDALQTNPTPASQMLGQGSYQTLYRLILDQTDAHKTRVLQTARRKNGRAASDGSEFPELGRSEFAELTRPSFLGLLL